MVAGLAAFFARLVDSVGAGWIPLYLLLLSRRLLQSILGGPALLHRGRASQELPWRKLIPTRHAEHPSLLPLPGHRAVRFAGLGRLDSDVVYVCHRQGI